jgi:hypothetical protein
MTEKEDLSIPIASTLVEQLKVLAMYEKRTIPKLIEEAVQNLLKKYTDKWFKK